MNRVLVVGERPDDAKALAFRIGLHGFEASPSASDLSLALRSLFAFKPDALVLDVEKLKGARDLFRLLERVAPIPIFVLGNGASGDDAVWYLEEGAADYLQKPVSPALLAARMGAVLRRMQDRPSDSYVVGDLEIDVGRRQVTKAGKPVALTPTEFALLAVLVENAGRACSHRYLLQRVWGEDFQHCSHYLRLYIGYLRNKLEDDPRNPRLLLTEWGVGYRLANAQPAAERARVPAVRTASARP